MLGKEQNNNTPSNQQLYIMVCDLTSKYKLLENKYNEKEKLIEKNKKNIILLNKQLLVFKTHLDENIKKFEKQINELEIKINEIHKKTNHINIDEINKLKIKFEDMEKSTNKMFESIRLNYNENKKLLFNNNEKEQKTYDLKKVLEDFENLLIIIISSEENEEIGKENLEKFKNISRILIKNKISPTQILSKYFTDNNKIAKNNNEIDFKILERISKLQKKLVDILYDIEYKLNYSKEEKDIQKVKNIDIISDFRKEFGISNKDFTDDEIKKLLKKHNNDKKKAYNAIKSKIPKKK